MTSITDHPMIALRAMQEDDLPAVLAVERSAYSAPWSEGIFRDCLRVRYPCVVAEWEARIIGHAVMSIAAGECHILNLCIHPRLHRRGIGRRILRRLLALARREGADTAFLEVRASNVSALALYRGEGFCEVGLRRDYYPAATADASAREDAVAMARAL
jgi:ribosomal-protein-alanine N-acetyltransferase